MACFTRREVIGAVAASGAAAWAAGCAPAGVSDWDAGEVAHVLPAASDSALLVKLSLTRPAKAASLRVNGVPAAGARTDTDGRYWRFVADGLQPDTVHRLDLRDGTRRLCDPWPLKTFPDPSAPVSRFRLLAFTCAGGPVGGEDAGGVESFRPLALRQRLLARAMSYEPDALIAIGDHIYWDQKAWLENANEAVRRSTRVAMEAFGMLDRNDAIFGGPNEDILRRIGEMQIVGVYGTRMRSTPTFFVGDDHDYFDNDEANDRFITFPPDAFQVRAARAMQRLFYPEFLPHATRPAGISGASAPDTGPGQSEAFGTIRVGTLFEAAVADCGRFLSLKGARAGLIPPDAEEWILKRIAAEETAHFAFIPSHPLGWTAGKWREWYPDVYATAAEVAGNGGAVVSGYGRGVSGGSLSVAREKFMWQAGWQAQHQRLAAALSAQTSRTALTLSGDLHAVGRGIMTRSGDLDLGANPLHTLLAGTIGTSSAGWPSFARGTPPVAPHGMTLDEPDGAPVEKNSFTLVDVMPDRVTARFFAWREPDPIEAIDTLTPFATVDLPRPA